MAYYYLVATQTQNLSFWQPQTSSDYLGNVVTTMVWQDNASVPLNTVMNCVSYDGTSEFIAPAGQQLKSSATMYNIGDAFVG